MPVKYTLVMVECFGHMCSPEQIEDAAVYKSEDGIVYLTMPGREDEMLGLGALSEWKMKLLLRKKVCWEHRYWDQ